MTNIWIYWEQGWENAPEVILECAKSWELLNPDYQVLRLSAQTIGEYLPIDSDLRDLLQGLRVQTKSDLFRLMLLQKHGGIWVDATLYCSSPLHKWLSLDQDSPVALFENPGPDRLVASWFIASLPNTRLIELWLKELLQFLRELPNPASPKNTRKLILKVLQNRWSGSPTKTLNWWRPLPQKMLSLTPYFIVHYCYNKLVLTNEEFSILAKEKTGFPAAPAHELQFALAGKHSLGPRQGAFSSPVHKLNWRKQPKGRSIESLIHDLRRGIVST